MAEIFQLKNRQISSSDKAAIQGIYSAMGDSAARYVQSIPLASIKPFPGHPYQVLDNADMDELMESISGSGVQEPILVWAVSEPWQGPEGETLAAPGDYILISGHRRKHASERLGLLTIPAILSTYTVDEARLAMVDANLRREKVLPSEKAYAYKIKYDALKHQGKRTDLTSRQVGEKLKAGKKLAETEKDSARQIERLIRLTELLPELLEMVDTKLLSLVSAVSLSYLDPAVQKPGYAVPPAKEQKPNQALLLSLIQTGTVSHPSMASAERLKEAARNGSRLLSRDEVIDLLSSDPKAQQKDLKHSEEKIQQAAVEIEDFLEPEDDEPLEFTITDCILGQDPGTITLEDGEEASKATETAEVPDPLSSLKKLLLAAVRGLSGQNAQDLSQDKEMGEILARLEAAIQLYRREENTCSI